MSSRPSQATDPTGDSACRLVLTGRVQGLGVRPAIYRLATSLKLAGTVRNTTRGVEIELEGAADGLEQFARRLPDELPDAVEIDRLVTETSQPVGRTEFTFVREPSDGPLTALVPADMAVCEDCLEEVRDAADRRHGYPFTSCTACGPRYTIIHTMPYERSDTTMSVFPLCPPCQAEYERPGDRRLHAQTNACPDCGPQVWCVDGSGRRSAAAEQAVHVAIRAIKSGKIVALRGLGGYQLLVDATRQEAVQRLREKKGRSAKPLAVMVGSVQQAHSLAFLDNAEEAALCDASNPIVLLRAKQAELLADGIHPHLDAVGLMLPTTPLHAILVGGVGQPLVCTSGNREGDPLEYEVDAAERNLAGLCDLMLHHDRPIARPIDDSVVRVIAGRRVTIRLARGLAPLSLDLPVMPPTLALGGYFKGAAAWSNGVQAVLGPHVGDQETTAARQRLLDQGEQWKELYRFEPQRLVHDMHPDYFTTRWAREQDRRLLAVQHHYAHIVAGMLEHKLLDREVMGVSWDGTGYGGDETIWGGEFLIAGSRSFQRFAHLRPFCLPGGEAAIHQPWRTALAVVGEALGTDAADHLPFSGVAPREKSLVRQIIDLPQFSPRTTSAGRLFDAAAAIVLGIEHVGFDGQAAMMLEAVAARDATGSYECPLRHGDTLQLDWGPLLRQLLADQSKGVYADVIAMRFHRALAAGIASVCRRRSDLPVVLSGGVFQNRLLTELIVEQFSDSPQRLMVPGIIPPNDGGLAAGQLAVASAQTE